VLCPGSNTADKPGETGSAPGFLGRISPLANLDTGRLIVTLFTYGDLAGSWLRLAYIGHLICGLTKR
jgi:hypothetical protein